MRVTSKPANEKARDIDSDGSPYRLLRYEQCLERSEETTSFGTREARMALAAHRASHWCTSRNRDRKSTRLNSSHRTISYAVFCLKKKTGESIPTHLAMVPSRRRLPHN